MDMNIENTVEDGVERGRGNGVIMRTIGCDGDRYTVSDADTMAKAADSHQSSCLS